jgi:Zn-finger nucleic acid-binding protein
MGDAATSCPRCALPLGSTSVRGVPVESCAKCSGSLLANPDLARMLEAVSVDLLQTFNPDAQIDACPHSEGRLSCPRCSHLFDQGDYCQAGLVTFDRCERCNVLWLGARELGTMTLMWARMEARYNRSHTENQVRLHDAQEFIDGFLLAQAVSSIVI